MRSGVRGRRVRFEWTAAAAPECGWPVSTHVGRQLQRRDSCRIDGVQIMINWLDAPWPSIVRLSRHGNRAVDDFIPFLVINGLCVEFSNNKKICYRLSIIFSRVQNTEQLQTEYCVSFILLNYTILLLLVLTCNNSLSSILSPTIIHNWEFIVMHSPADWSTVYEHIPAG